MGQKKQQIGLIWITKQGFYLYAHGELSQFRFSEDSIQYLDIVNESLFQTKLDSFFLQNLHIPTTIHCIIGPDALVEKEFPLTYRFEDVQKFFDLVPFEQIFSKLRKGESSYTAYAFNAELYYRLQSAVQRTGGKIESVVPYFITGQKTFDQSSIAAILKKEDLFVHENMVVSEASSYAFFETAPQENKPKETKSTLPLLLPVLGVLIIVLIIVVILSRQSEKPVPKLNAINKNQVVTPPIATESGKLKTDILIVINYQVAATESAGTVRNRLLSAGYRTVTLKESQSPIDTTLILIKTGISPFLRSEITSIVSSVSASPIIQESGTIADDIEISLKNP